MSVRTSGWSWPSAASVIYPARSNWARAAAGSPMARSTRPKLPRQTPTFGWSGPSAASPGTFNFQVLAEQVDQPHPSHPTSDMR